MQVLRTILLAFTGALILLSSACGRPDRPAGTVVAIEDAEAHSGKVYIEELLVREIRTVDSVMLSKDASTVVDVPLDVPGFYLLRFEDGQVFTLFLEPGEKVSLRTINEQGYQGYEVQGSPGSEILMEYFLRRSLDEQVLDSLGKVFRESRSDPDFVNIRAILDSQYYALLEQHREWAFRFILDHDTSLVSLFILNQRFGAGPVFTEEDAFGLMERLDSVLYTRFPENIHARDHHQRVNTRRREIFELELALERLAPGKPAPDLTMRDPEGREWKLGKFAGQPVLLHFWASTDALSRRDNRQLPALVAQHPWLMTVSVSMDVQREAWKAAVALDALEWTQVSELLGMDGPAARKYLPEKELPYYCLIDARGKLVFRTEDISELAMELDNFSR